MWAVDELLSDVITSNVRSALAGYGAEDVVGWC
jgi:hypothetical protein